MRKQKGIAWWCWSATRSITAASASRPFQRDGQPCRDRWTTAACWWPSSSMARSPTFPARSARTGAWRDNLARPRRHSQLLRNAGKEASARPELWREHADTGPVPDLVDLVEQVDDVEPHRGRLGPSREKVFVRYPGIDLGVGWHVIGIRKARPQTAAIDHRRAEARAIPQIGSAG